MDLTRIICAVTREARLGLRSATAQFDRPLKDAVPRLEVPFSRPFGAPAVLHPSSKLCWDSGSVYATAIDCIELPRSRGSTEPRRPSSSPVPHEPRLRRDPEDDDFIP